MTATTTDYRSLNAALGILGIFMLGIFLAWYLTKVHLIPLPKDPVWASLVGAFWQTFATVVIPYVWAMRRLGLKLADMGIRRAGFVDSTLQGCLLYSLALGAFIYCSSDPLISNHLLRHLGAGDASITLASMGLIAAGTDLATRGFILLTLVRYTNLAFAILIQNLTWYLGHINEIGLLSGCLGLWGALGLTLTLGLLGDVVALRTRNVVGLALAHILLNLAMTVYIRNL